MKFVWTLIFSAIWLTVSADCGCLKCGKHLKIISPPNSPVTVIERGEACICEKPIPYHIEIPQIVCKPCHRPRSYGYKVHSVSYVKPEDPVLCQHGYKVEVPYVPKCPCHYYQGLVAKTDRIVIPAKDECPPPPPSCCGPTFEYISPRECCDDCYYCRRKKRDLKAENEEFNWIKSLQPKTIRSSSIRNPWTEEQFVKIPAPKITLLERLKDLKDKFEMKKNKRTDQNRREPYRINIPLDPKKQFFRGTKRKPPSLRTIHEERFEMDPRPDRKSKKTFTRFIEKSGKFADVENVKISTPQRGREKSFHPIKKRKTRSLIVEDKTFPYYKISSAIGKRRKPLFKDLNEKSLRYLQPFDIESMVPKNQIYYILNTPIRMLNHVKKMREHINPMVRSIPDVLDTSSVYVIDLSKRFRKGTMDFLKEFPSKIITNLIRPQRNKREPIPSIQTRMMLDDPIKLEKRAAIVKLVEDDEVHEFLKDKLSIFASREEDEDGGSSEEDLLAPITPKISRKNPLKLEKLTPKLILNDGHPYLDIEGTKRPLTPSKRKIPHPQGDSEDIQDMIEEVIEEAKLMASNPRGFNNRQYESEMCLQTIKAKISATLEDIQGLIEEDFDKYDEIYAKLLELQHLKESVVDEWKYILIKKKQNDYSAKINLLNKFNQILSVKDDLIGRISDILIGAGRSFNTNHLIKKLIRLQKLQCVLVRIVEDFSERIRYRTECDIAKEIKQVDFLKNFDLIPEKTTIELSTLLREERDVEVERKIELLNRLKGLLNGEICQDKVDRVGKLLWEISNSEKLQRDTMAEMKEKIRNGSRIRKELKIIFDLERQIEICQTQLGGVLRDISQEKDGKFDNKVGGKIKMKMKPARKKELVKRRKPLALLNKNKVK